MKVNRRDGFLVKLYLQYQDKDFYDSFRLFLIVSGLNITLLGFSNIYSTPNSISVNKWDFFFLPSPIHQTNVSVPFKSNKKGNHDNHNRYWSRNQPEEALSPGHIPNIYRIHP
jgi:hypothetical protein